MMYKFEIGDTVIDGDTEYIITKRYLNDSGDIRYDVKSKGREHPYTNNQEKWYTLVKAVKVSNWKNKILQQ